MLQDLVGKKAKIIGPGESTEDYFGYDEEDMGILIGETGEIEGVIGCILDSRGDVKHLYGSEGYSNNKADRTVIGVEMFGFSWHINDIEILPVKERKTKKTEKTFKFDPNNIMLEEKKNANKPSRSRVIGSVSSPKRKSSIGNRTSKKSSKPNGKRTIKVRK